MRPIRAVLAVSPFALAALTLAGDAAARPPAYTMHAGFRTSLDNVPEQDRREECLDLACKEKGGTLVAQGTVLRGGVALAVKIREYRHHTDQTREGLEGIAKKMLAKGLDDREIRLVAGKANDRDAIEQWSVVNACQRQFGGRVLVSLSDKVVEIEAVATAPSLDARVVAGAVSDVSSVLHGLRVRRVGDVTIDPAPDAPPPDEVGEAVSKACL